MFTKALVPLDGTEVSEGIIPFMTQLARGMEMTVVLATVVDLDPIQNELISQISGGMTETRTEGRSPARPVSNTRPPVAEAVEGRYPQTAQLMERIERDVNGRLSELADRIAMEGIFVETSVRFGSASENIIEMAKDSDCDLIAMSTRGRNVLQSGLLGSVTYKVMHESPMPVLAITPERAERHWCADYGISRVIVPLDGSELAEAALPYAAALSRKMDMSLSLVRVVYLDSVLYSGGYEISHMLPDVEDQVMSEAREYLAGAARPLREEGLDVQEKILRGKASSEITDLARATDHNMIALATHGRSGMSRIVLGSVAESVVRESGDPVLVIRPSD